MADYKNLRLLELESIKNLYPHSFRIIKTLENYRSCYHDLNNDETLTNIEYVSGRIKAIRSSGCKLYFAVIESDGVQLQVLANAKYYDDKDEFALHKRILRRGDIIGAIGLPTRSSKGELSILPNSVVLLAPCLYSIPNTIENVFTDDGLRFKQRYLDFIIHPDHRQIFKIRALILRFIRRYLDDRDFIEVETPILSTKVGGANAKPFITHHNDLDKPMNMRIAPELYLKQLIIGGFERVYEIGKQFRNESIDASHNPEFTSIEMYQTYADYFDMIHTVEELLSSLIMSITGSYTVQYGSVKIDFIPPFKQLDLISSLQSLGGFTLPKDLESEEARQFLINTCQERNIICSDPKTIPRLLDKLVGVYIEPLCINPTFIINHPQIMSPLAKYHRENNSLTERFELFIGGREYANAYTELNDPRVQKSCFEGQAKDKSLGDTEAQINDDDFIKALEYGLPPTGGLGIGIDRLVMLLTNQSSIKEVITFQPC